MKLFKLLSVLCLLLLVISPLSVAQAKTIPIRVWADIEWNESGITLEAGQTYNIKANGLAITGPLNEYPEAKSGPAGQTWNLTCDLYHTPPMDCNLFGAPYGALVGKVGEFGEPFLIGDASSFIAPEAGLLLLAVNDNIGTHFDNLAGFTILFLD